MTAPFLDLIQLADHPGDRLTYRHFRLTPLAAVLYPHGVPTAAEISVEMANRLAARGLEGTLRELFGLLPPPDFQKTLRDAARFEQAMGTTDRYSDFVRTCTQA